MRYSTPTRSKYKLGGKVGGKVGGKAARQDVQGCKKGMKCAGKNTADKFGKGMSTYKKKRPKPGKKTPVSTTPVKSSASHVNPRFMKSASSENTSKVRAKADGLKNKGKIAKRVESAKNNIDRSKVNVQSNLKSKVGSVKKKKDEFATVTRPTASSYKKGGKIGKKKKGKNLSALAKANAKTSALKGYGYETLSPMEVKKLKLKKEKDVKMKRKKPRKVLIKK
jgi:hypothetical protein